MEAEIMAIKRVLDHYAHACCTGDMNDWLSLWGDDGRQMPPDAPARIGKEQIRDGMKYLFDEMRMELSILSIEDAEIHGDLGLTRCVYTLDVTPRAGGETIKVMAPGKALTLYKKQSDGTWKIAYDCFNSSVPPGPE